MVQWIKPPHGKVKINTDGSFSHDGAGIGGIVRDQNGDMIMAFVVPVQCGSNNLTEAYVAKFELQWCLQ